jgi:GMP synthase (glutamine-hydrolysing)
MIEKTRLAIIKTGDTLDTVKAHAGDFHQMFLEQLGELGVDARVVQAHKDEALPNVDDVDVLLVTGSPYSVTERQPWAERTSQLLGEAISSNKWVLGVCYGHQLLAHALGGTVEKNPNGYEVGTINVELTEAGKSDPLFSQISRGEPTLAFHSTHSDAVVRAPSHARVLASTRSTEVQAFAVGERAWGVQFHPEFTPEVMSLYVEGRTPLIEKYAQERGLDPAAEVARAKRSVHATPAGRALLRAFVEMARR